MSLLPISKDDDDTTDNEVLHAEDEARAVEITGDAILPDCAMDPEDVEGLSVPYSTRAPDDWVSAGTLDPLYNKKAAKKGWRTLRYFPSWEDAEEWARKQFGDRFKGRIVDAQNSGSHWWAFLIKGPRGVNDAARAN